MLLLGDDFLSGSQSGKKVKSTRNARNFSLGHGKSSCRSSIILLVAETSAMLNVLCVIVLDVYWMAVSDLNTFVIEDQDLLVFLLCSITTEET